MITKIKLNFFFFLYKILKHNLFSLKLSLHSLSFNKLKASLLYSLTDKMLQEILLNNLHSDTFRCVAK